MFNFPKPIPLTKHFIDFLEQNPGKKYFLSNELYRFFDEKDKYCKSHKLGYRFAPVERERCRMAKTITTKEGSRIENNFIREAVHTDSNAVWKANVEEREYSESLQFTGTLPDTRNKRRRATRSENND